MIKIHNLNHIVLQCLCELDGNPINGKIDYELYNDVFEKNLLDRLVENYTMPKIQMERVVEAILERFNSSENLSIKVFFHYYS